MSVPAVACGRSEDEKQRRYGDLRANSWHLTNRNTPDVVACNDLDTTAPVRKPCWV
jgi:hypothetical protein